MCSALQVGRASGIGAGKLETHQVRAPPVLGDILPPNDEDRTVPVTGTLPVALLPVWGDTMASEDVYKNVRLLVNRKELKFCPLLSGSSELYQGLILRCSD